MRFVALLLAAMPLAAQHDMNSMPGMDMPGMNNTTGSEPMEASGTSRNPASAPAAMIHVNVRRWTVMIHGAAFVGEIRQTGPRGHDKFASMNWAMAEAEHSLGGGTFAIRTMLSLDPATITGRFYPELFQTGETAYGKPIVDGQHPHNLFMEAAVEYRHPLGDHASWEIYVAPVGDPALGPVAYPHRAAAEELPLATLGHHLEDSTHVSYDVVTGAITAGIFRFEASGFHGAEPGENRSTVGYGSVDSWSGRFSVAPAKNWMAEFSGGHVTAPEALEPGDQNRLSGSVSYNRNYSHGNWASSAIWGRVHKLADKVDLDGYTFESLARFASRNAVTGRIEIVDKDELPVPGIYRIGAYTAGYTRDFPLFPRIATGLGFNLTAYSMPAAIHSLYGARPVGMMVFLHFKVRQAS